MLVGDVLLQVFGPCGNDVFVITVVMVMLLRDFGPHGIIFVTMCVCYFKFSRSS
jgi:hypothetical protein